MFWFYVILVIVASLVIAVANNKSHNDAVQTSTDANERYMQDTGFEVDTKFEYNDSAYGNNVQVFVDNHNNRLMILNGRTGSRAELDFKDIIGMEYREDGVSTNGVGRAAVGGVLFGGTGAVVGAVTGKKTVQNVKMIIYVTDIVNPFVEINLNHSSKIKCDSFTYKQIMEFERRLDATVRAILAKNESGETEKAIQFNSFASSDFRPNNDSSNEIKQVDYFLMYQVESSNAGMMNLKGLWCLTGFAINCSTVVGKKVDLYNENMELMTTVNVKSMTDYSQLGANRICLHLENFSGEGIPKIAFAVEAGGEINESMVQHAKDGYYNGNSNSL